MKKTFIPIGVDIIEINRIQSAIDRWRGAFLNRIYTEAELGCCRERYSSLAARFAAKEAILKVLGGEIAGASWRDIEILSGNNETPLVKLHGKVRKRANEVGLTSISVSLSHSKKYAVAVSIGHAG